MTHGCHIYAKGYDMAKATRCAYSQSYHELPHWKCLLRCCDKCTSINITDQETDDQYPGNSPSISFHIYHIIARCTKHGRLPLNDKKNCRKCQQDTDSGQPTQIYTRRELVMMETTIYNYHASFYIPEIQKLAFQITHIQILGMNHCGESRKNAFKRQESFQDVLCRCYYAERVVASFDHQIQL